MNCPTDSTPMGGGSQGAMRYEACPRCRGLWVNPETLAAPRTPVFVLFKSLPGIEPTKEEETGPPTCHDCRLTLVPREVAATRIDLCPRCGSVWLGAGEFDRVAEWYRAHPKTEWPRASQLEAQPVLPGGERDRSGLPKGAKAYAGRPVVSPGDDDEPEDPSERMKRAVKLLGKLVDRGLAE